MAGHINKIVVFCGSQFGRDQAIIQEAQKLGRLLGESRYNLIYGGGADGLMGVVSRAAIQSGARVKGIIPKIFWRAAESLPDGSEEDVVENMMLRKDAMILQADAAIALPGGDGTIDEITEIVVAQQVKTYDAPDQIIQPVIVVNYNGYFDDYIRQRQKAVAMGFLSPAHEKLITFVADAQEAVDLLNRLNAREPEPARHYQPAPRL